MRDINNITIKPKWVAGDHTFWQNRFSAIAQTVMEHLEDSLLRLRDNWDSKGNYTPYCRAEKADLRKEKQNAVNRFIDGAETELRIAPNATGRAYVRARWQEVFEASLGKFVTELEEFLESVPILVKEAKAPKPKQMTESQRLAELEKRLAELEGRADER